MPFLAAPWVAPLIGIGGAAASAFGGRNKGSNTQTSQTTPQLTPEQQALQRNLIGRVSSGLDTPYQPGKSSQAYRNQAVTNINQNTDNSRKRLETNLAGRGFGRSGLIAAGANDLEANRVNAIGNLDAQIVQFLEDQERQHNQLQFENALSLLGGPTGQISTSTSRDRAGFDPFQFLAPFLDTEAFNFRGGGGNSGGSDYGPENRGIGG